MIRFSSTTDHSSQEPPTTVTITTTKRSTKKPKETEVNAPDDETEEAPTSKTTNSVEENVIRIDDDLLLKSNLPSSSDSSARRRQDQQQQSSSLKKYSCRESKNCLDCLFRSTSSSKIVEQQEEECVWLAAREQCVESSFAKKNLPGVDLEDVACPAILHSSSPQEKSRLVPAKFNVIHVAIRKGGPEALIQLHLALTYWGFNTNLDTRKSKKQKGGPVVPFFKEMYAKEFSRVNNIQQQFRSNFQDYDQWQKSGKEGDVLIATETWKCRNDRTSSSAMSSLLSEPIELRKNGVRYAQWHLTVWPRKPRTG